MYSTQRTAKHRPPGEAVIVEREGRIVKVVLKLERQEKT